MNHIYIHVHIFTICTYVNQMSSVPEGDHYGSQSEVELLTGALAKGG